MHSSDSSLVLVQSEMFTHFSCSCFVGQVEVETDQAKLTETTKQRTAGKSSEQVIESIVLILFICKEFVVYLQLPVCQTGRSMVVSVYVNCCLFSTIYSCQLMQKKNMTNIRKEKHFLIQWSLVSQSLQLLSITCDLQSKKNRQVVWWTSIISTFAESYSNV